MSLLNWPQWAERTPDHARESSDKFSVGYRQTKGELNDEMDRMGVEEWRLDDVTGSGGDPGVVVRWTMDGQDRAICCDAYDSKGANLRACYLWINETRMSGDRPVKTGQDQFAAAALPGEVGGEPVEPSKPPHEVLNVSPDAPDAVVEAAAKARKKEAHPDNGGSTEEFQRVVEAEEAMLQ